MSFNIVEIKVRTDYTDFSNAVSFTLNVPVTQADADATYKELSAGAWDDVEKALNAAVDKGAPQPIQSLVKQLLKAYSGKEPSAQNNQPDSPQHT